MANRKITEQLLQQQDNDDERRAEIESRVSKDSSFSEEERRIRIRTTEGTDVKGYVFLEGTSFDRRVSNLLNDPRKFVSLTKAELYLSGRKVTSHEFICINKEAIAYVTEED